MPKRARLTVDLSAELQAWLLREVEAGGFGTPAEYLRHLVKAARAASSAEHIEKRLLASLDSGPPVRMTERKWDALAKRAEARIASLREERSRRQRRKSA